MQTAEQYAAPRPPPLRPREAFPIKHFSSAPSPLPSSQLRLEIQERPPWGVRSLGHVIRPEGSTQSETKGLSPHSLPPTHAPQTAGPPGATKSGARQYLPAVRPPATAGAGNMEFTKSWHLKGTVKHVFKMALLAFIFFLLQNACLLIVQKSNSQKKVSVKI